MLPGSASFLPTGPMPGVPGVLPCDRARKSLSIQLFMKILRSFSCFCGAALGPSPGPPLANTVFFELSDFERSSRVSLAPPKLPWLFLRVYSFSFAFFDLGIRMAG